MGEEGRFLLPWAVGMRCHNNEEASLTWMVIRNALWVGKRLFAAQLTISPECVRCSALEESIEHAFFHCLVVLRGAIFLKVSWYASWMELFLSWKPVLWAAMWLRSWPDRNIMCFFTYLALYVSWFWRRDWRNSATVSLFPLIPWCLFTSTKLKSKGVLVV